MTIITARRRGELDFEAKLGSVFSNGNFHEPNIGLIGVFGPETLKYDPKTFDDYDTTAGDLNVVRVLCCRRHRVLFL